MPGTCAPYLLTLLNVGHRVRLKVQLVRAAEFPVEDDDNHRHHQHWDDHADDDPEAAALGLRRRPLHPVHGCREKVCQQLPYTLVLGSPPCGEWAFYEKPWKSLHFRSRQLVRGYHLLITGNMTVNTT